MAATGNQLPVTVAVTYDSYNSGAVGARPVTRSDVSISPSDQAYVSFAPPVDSQQHFWQNTPSVVAFRLTAPIGSVVDVDLEMVLQDKDPPLASRALSGSATAGTIGVCFATSTSTSAAILVPLELASFG